MTTHIITSLPELIASAHKPATFAVMLAFGLYSRKRIAYNARTRSLSVYNYIDSTREVIPLAHIRQHHLYYNLMSRKLVKIEV